LSTANQVLFANKIEVLPNGNIAIPEPSSIVVYKAPVKKALGSPIRTTALKAPARDELQAVAITPSESSVWVLPSRRHGLR
jgi:hypothetical protein